MTGKYYLQIQMCDAEGWYLKTRFSCLLMLSTFRFNLRLNAESIQYQKVYFMVANLSFFSLFPK